MVKQSPATDSTSSGAENVVTDGRIAALAAEVMARCDALALCGADPTRIERTFCSPAMREAHALVTSWMQAAGMTTRVDAAGNLVGRYEPPGCDASRRVIIGSHLDTVVDAGRYDGMLGVMLGIATAAALREADVRLPWAIEVYGFSDEEGVRFKVPFLGSRAVAGTFDPELLKLRDGDDVTVEQALREFGVEPREISACAAQGNVVAYLEAHIEQGPLLEMLGTPVGAVAAIAGQSRLTFEWAGPGGHSGTVPMHGRRDAFTAACRWALAVEKVAQDTAGLVATVGRVDVDPNATNCIPRRVRASLDIRHHGDEVRRVATQRLVALAEELARDSHLTLRVEYDHEHAAVPMDQRVSGLLMESVTATGHEPQWLVSGAGHDAGVMAKIAPIAMLFVRCRGGVSHSPEESVTQADVEAALRVMTDFVRRLGAAKS